MGSPMLIIRVLAIVFGILPCTMKASVSNVAVLQAYSVDR